jgi:hypothetical protein
MDPTATIDLLPFTALTVLIRIILLTSIPAPLTVPIVLHILFIHLYTAWRTDFSILLHTFKRWLGIHQLIEDIEQVRYERRRIRARVDMVRRRVIWEKKMEMYREMTRERERELGMDREWKMEREREMGMDRERKGEYYVDRGRRRVETTVGGRLKAARRVVDWVEVLSKVACMNVFWNSGGFQ